MKIITFALLTLLLSFSTAKTSKTVYLCISETAVAYHIDRDCKGLSRCTHKIVETTLETAIEKYNRRACRYCCN